MSNAFIWLYNNTISRIWVQHFCRCNQLNVSVLRWMSLLVDQNFEKLKMESCTHGFDQLEFFLFPVCKTEAVGQGITIRAKFEQEGRVIFLYKKL